MALDSVKSLTPILKFILSHVRDDERSFLKVTILGKSILGLLDTGATRTILSSRGWSSIKYLQIPSEGDRRMVCRVATGATCRSISSCRISIGVAGRKRLIDVIAVPDIPYVLILDIDFFKCIGVVPDLHNDCWYFAGTTVAEGEGSTSCLSPTPPLFCF